MRCFSCLQCTLNSVTKDTQFDCCIWNSNTLLLVPCYSSTAAYRLTILLLADWLYIYSLNITDTWLSSWCNKDLNWHFIRYSPLELSKNKIKQKYHINQEIYHRPLANQRHYDLTIPMLYEASSDWTSVCWSRWSTEDFKYDYKIQSVVQSVCYVIIIYSFNPRGSKANSRPSRTNFFFSNQ